jgi:hypothetical protein
MAVDTHTSERSILVILLPYPSQGHVNPIILQFGKRLSPRIATWFVLSKRHPYRHHIGQLRPWVD